MLLEGHFGRRFIKQHTYFLHRAQLGRGLDKYLVWSSCRAAHDLNDIADLDTRGIYSVLSRRKYGLPLLDLGAAGHIFHFQQVSLACAGDYSQCGRRAYLTDHRPETRFVSCDEVHLSGQWAYGRDPPNQPAVSYDRHVQLDTVKAAAMSAS